MRYSSARGGLPALDRALRLRGADIERVLLLCAASSRRRRRLFASWSSSPRALVSAVKPLANSVSSLPVPPVACFSRALRWPVLTWPRPWLPASTLNTAKLATMPGKR
eukprot:92817-Rhodomonas_salina.1